MDIFKFHNPNDPTKFEQGEIINGLKSKMWVERYRDAGEFTLVANADSGMRDILPIGTCISHLDTPEIMIVENHEINDNKGERAEITITGRGFETFLEQRVVGNNFLYPATTYPSDYELLSNYSWQQARVMIMDHIGAPQLVDDDNALNYVTVWSYVPGEGLNPMVKGIGEPRKLKPVDLYKATLDLISNDDLGIRNLRPGPWIDQTHHPVPLSDALIEIHVGEDRSKDLAFAYDSGEIESADYLWSNKVLKNAAFVVGRWVQNLVIPPTAVGYARRWMFVNGSDLDSSLEEAPAGTELTDMLAAMRALGLQALASQNNIALTKAEVSKQAVKAKYRIDYNVGDLVSVKGDYNESSIMRVTEYVEIEDKTGISGYPTLSVFDLEGL